jgi:hypothetical protein
MKNFFKKAGIIAFVALISFSFASCEEASGPTGGGITVTIISITANGSQSQTTTQLALLFDQTVSGLSASDISLSGLPGISKGALTGDRKSVV